MHILVLNYEFPPVGGGGGRVAEDICRELANMGHEIRVQTAHLKGLPKIESRNGFTIYRSPSLRRRADTCTIPEMVAFILLNISPTLRHIREFKPDVIHVHFAVPTGFIAWAIHHLTKIPYVLTTHLGDIPGAVPEQTDRYFYFIKPFTVRIWKDAACVTTVSESNRQLASKSYDVQIQVIPNGIKLKENDGKPPDIHQIPRLVFAGRFNPQKNLLFLVDILKEIADLNWEMDMLGDGPLFNTVKEKLIALNLQDRVHLRGWICPDSVESIMNESDILLLPSISEGMSVVGVQALSHGLAILGSNIGGITDVVENGINGYLCPVNDLDAFSKSLRIMLSSGESLRKMKMASKFKANEFDLNQIVQSYEKVLIEAAAK